MATQADFRNVITSAFSAFGYTPSEEEINQFIPIVNAKQGGAERGRASVASYVRAVKLQQEFRKNDPLNQVIADERGFFTDTERKAGELEGRLEGPVKLFGGLDPNQIDQYLKPLSNSYKASGADLEGAAARRGISGSSTEFNGLAENERKFREDVLSTGLNVGLNDRQIQQQRLLAQYGLLSGSLGRQGQIAGQQSGQYADDQRYLSELPLYLRSVSSQEQAVQDAIAARDEASRNARKAGIARLAGTAIGAIPGLATGNPLLAVGGAQLGGQIGGSIYGDSGGDSSGAYYALAASRGTTRMPLFRGGNSVTLPATADAGIAV